MRFARADVRRSGLPGTTRWRRRRTVRNNHVQPGRGLLRGLRRSRHLCRPWLGLSRRGLRGHLLAKRSMWERTVLRLVGAGLSGLSGTIGGNHRPRHLPAPGRRVPGWPVRPIRNLHERSVQAVPRPLQHRARDLRPWLRLGHRPVRLRLPELPGAARWRLGPPRGRVRAVAVRRRCTRVRARALVLLPLRSRRLRLDLHDPALPEVPVAAAGPRVPSAAPTARVSC
jgi:hypothetical protein